MDPKVGVSVLVFNNNGRGVSYLMGRRKSDHGKGLWGLPGGHLEMGEDPIACAVRELKEETGLDLTEPYFHGMTNDVFGPDKHYITLFIAGTVTGTPQLMEPDKCEGWEWVSLDMFPEEELFLPIRNMMNGNFYYGYQG